MKKLFSYLILTFVIAAVNAQINFTIVTKDVECNHIAFGDAEVNVTPTNPPYFYLWSNGATTPAIHDLDEGTYSLTIIDDSGDDTIVVVKIKYLECEMHPEVIFTPNNDAINDTWSVTNSEYFPQARILVFNRLGQKVFEHNGIYEPWDGKDIFGAPLPDASYYYVIYHKGSDDGTIIKGCVSILK